MITVITAYSNLSSSKIYSYQNHDSFLKICVCYTPSVISFQMGFGKSAMTMGEAGGPYAYHPIMTNNFNNFALIFKQYTVNQV